MSAYTNMSKAELEKVFADLQTEYKEYQEKNLKLDMSRGKPNTEQLDLSEELLTCVNNCGQTTVDGVDLRNYGGLDGIPAMKNLFAEMLDVSADEIIVGGNSSLNMMYDTVSRAMLYGVMGSTPWCKLPKVKFLCPVPGYDRHFAICESLGIEMVNIPMTETGPDMNEVERLVNNDESVKGIWCVPKYSNPQGITYSAETVERFANLKPAAPDFRIFWDNAYCVHELTDTPDELVNIIDACKKAGNPNLCYMFASTSKIVFPGAGVAVLVSSKENIDATKKIISAQTIGPDKINQLRHVVYFKNADGVKAHMKKHAEIIAPKFNIVTDMLEKELTGLDIASWVKPKGGYFISLDVLSGCAKRVHTLLKEAGVVMTGAGATFPYGKDPMDTNLRIAPTYPSNADLEIAAYMLCLCVKLAACEKLLNK